jgi:hypothetical protein
MVATTDKEKLLLRDLGNGLIMRRSSSADAGALAEFDSMIHGDMEKKKPDARVGVWVRDLLTKPHPTFDSGDFTIVEDTHRGKIVSSLNLISQTWSYGGIQFGVGRPELVGTHPDYRNRGLVRAQFEEIHQWSAARGEKAQAITGIPYYYRQFGYEMCLPLEGGRAGYKPQVPWLKEGEKEPYRIRPALVDDIPFIEQLYRQACKRHLVACIRDEKIWRYEIEGKSSQNVDRREMCLIETPDGEPVGYLAHPGMLWGSMMAAVAYEVKPGVSWAVVTPTIIRFLYKTGEKLAIEEKKSEDFAAFGFWVGAEHPVYQVLHGSLPRVRKPYAWYMRIPDLPGFLAHIAPVLESRLADSVLCGHSGEMNLTFYRSGLHFVFERGKLVNVKSWKPAPLGDSGDAAFPELTFLQIMFGYRSLDELHEAFPDCWFRNDQTYVLLSALFPKMNSDIWPIS